MMTAEERYARDAEFHALVDILRSFIAQGRYTPTELREALVLAATHYEMYNPRPLFVWGPHGLVPFDRRDVK